MATKAKSTKPVQEKQFIFTAENVVDVTAKINDGYSIKRYMNPWFMGETGVRRAGCVYSITEDEVQEYIKCKLDIHYFSEKYCKIKREDGTIGAMKLRDYQKDILDLYTKNRFSILMASRQVGKALRHGSSVWKINGEDKIENLKIGDQIFGDDGKLTTVTGVYPQGKKENYRITFDDDTYVDCCGEHLWEVSTSDGNSKVIDVNSIKDNYLDKRGHSKFYVKMNKPVQYETKNLPIDPYLLGLLIGDGNINNGVVRLSSIDEEIINYSKSIAKDYNCTLVKIDDRCDYRFGTNNKGGKNVLHQGILKLGLNVKSGLKFIPKEFLLASTEQRLELLRGLMDTDGSIDNRSVIEYNTISKQLSVDFELLCNSLGIKTKCVTRTTKYTYKGEKRTGKLCYRIRIYLNHQCDIFKLTRKKEKIRFDKKFNWGNKRSIRNIESIGYQECTCISVDNENKLFLTNSYIPTHNTVSAAIAILHFVLFNNDKNVMIIANKGDTAIEIVDKIKSIYRLLPFFLQKGVKNWNQKSLIFENGCRIKTSARSKTPAIGFTIDFLYMDEFAHIPSNIIEPYYTAAFPTVSALSNSKIVITSTPNGMNMFYKLLSSAERPEGDKLKNNYKSMRVYWWQVPNRFVTYLRLDNGLMHEHGITKEQIIDRIRTTFDWSEKEADQITEFFDYAINRDVIHIQNSDKCSSDGVREIFITNKDGIEIPLAAITDITSWKEEAIKDIGGEEAFNQEYDLRFVNASKSLFDEKIIDELLKSKVEYNFESIIEFDRKLRWSYQSLKWIDNEEIFQPIARRNYDIVMSVDIAEGLGQDYSIVNIFRVVPKSREKIESQYKNYTCTADFFSLVQIGLFRSNLVSVQQLAELVYMLGFEYFNSDRVKVVLELNTYGSELLAHMPHVFDGNNNYGSSVFVRYKHRADAIEEKIGLKINDNKNLLIKDYQDAMQRGDILVNNSETIHEITTFIKTITSAGNVRYQADTGNDDTVMTLVSAATTFKKMFFKELCEQLTVSGISKEMSIFISEKLKNVDYSEGTDYGSLIAVNKNRKFMKQYKNSQSNSGSNIDVFGRRT